MRYSVIVLALSLLAVFAVVATAAPALDQPTDGQEPAYKQAFEAARQADQALLDQGAHALKHPEVVPAASCPNTNFATGVFPFRFGPFFGGRHIVNYAAASLRTTHYIVYAGAPDDAPEQGLIRVLSEPADPCMAAGPEAGTRMRDYMTRSGPLTIMGVNDSKVEFVRPGGAGGQFDFVAGQFLP